jgi:hypothetical protein
MSSKCDTETGKFVRFVAPGRSKEAATKVTILQPKQRPTSISLREIRKAVRDVHGSKDK